MRIHGLALLSGLLCVAAAACTELKREIPTDGSPGSDTGAGSGGTTGNVGAGGAVTGLGGAPAGLGGSPAGTGGAGAGGAGGGTSPGTGGRGTGGAVAGTGGATPGVGGTGPGAGGAAGARDAGADQVDTRVDATTDTGVTPTPARLTLTAATTTAYGTVTVGTPKDLTFVVTNAGQQATSAVGVTASGFGFSLLSPATGECTPGVTVLAGGASCNVRVRFNPVAGTTTYAAVMTATATTGGSAMLAVTGTGQTPALLTLTVPSGGTANFGTVTVGTPKTLAFVVTNTGMQATSAITVSLSANDHFSILSAVTGDCGAAAVLMPGAFCNVRVSFPGATGGGATSATLTATATAGGTATLALTGDAHKRATVDIVLAPGSSFDYGMVIVSGAAKTMTYVVRNTGDDVASGIGLSLFPADNGFSFTNATGDCVDGMTDLAPGATCTVHVRLAALPPGGTLTTSLEASVFQDVVTRQGFAVNLTAFAVFQ